MKTLRLVAAASLAGSFLMAPAFAEDTSCQPTGGAATAGYDNGKYFVADSFSFGVEREMKESGEKSGSGELKMSLKKGFEGRDDLYRYFESKEPIAELTIATEGRTADGRVCYLKYKLDRCFVKSWSVSGDADDRPTEEVAFYYNKIASSYSMTKDGKR